MCVCVWGGGGGFLHTTSLGLSRTGSPIKTGSDVINVFKHCWGQSHNARSINNRLLVAVLILVLLLLLLLRLGQYAERHWLFPVLLVLYCASREIRVT